MSNITVTHSTSGLVHAAVARTERVTPNMVRVTLAGGDLDAFDHRGFDQWFRLAIPVRDHEGLDRMPAKFGIAGYLKYLTMPKGMRPVVRNYTVRAYRTAAESASTQAELDIDFVVHGTDGVAGPWALNAEPGSEVALIDQGCGYAPVPADSTLIVADESGLPAAVGVLRDLPRDATGHAVIELFDADDRQEVDAPEGVTVHWLERGHDEAPGARALPTLRDLEFDPASVYAFAVGESALATGARRHLVGERGVAKRSVTFSGYWKLGRAAG
ncbi:MAG: siderophore-interacting protein [Pseudoclavibacter sp.]